jgi:hypothetical protein
VLLPLQLIVCQFREALNWFAAHDSTVLLLCRISIESRTTVLRNVLMILTSYQCQDLV